MERSEREIAPVIAVGRVGEVLDNKIRVTEPASEQI